MKKQVRADGVRQLLENDKDVFITAVDAARAIADALGIPRVEAHQLMWQAQRAGSLQAKVIANRECVNARDVRAIVMTWRNAE